VIGLDTNVLIRYIIRDDEDQTGLADSMIDGFTVEEPGYVSHIVLVEMWWVLTSAYGQDRRMVAALIDRLLAVATVVVENPDLVHAALRAVTANGADFADAMIGATGASAGCTQTSTFDKRAAARAGLTLLV
jgi:predicted nucleic-acid-binding protein